MIKEVTPITTVFKEYRDYYLHQKKELLAILKSLPKGTQKKRKIKNQFYYYLHYRVGEKVRDKYIGKSFSGEIQKQLEERKWIKMQLKKIDPALYALGIARRSQGPGPGKRFSVLERDNFTCQYCGRNPKVHKVVLVVDHINPKKRGGDDSIDNLITACVECNLGKLARLLNNTKTKLDI
jgi:predicted restriction endonuclease